MPFWMKIPTSAYFRQILLQQIWLEIVFGGSVNMKIFEITNPAGATDSTIPPAKNLIWNVVVNFLEICKVTVKIFSYFCRKMAVSPRTSAVVDYNISGQVGYNLTIRHLRMFNRRQL